MANIRPSDSPAWKQVIKKLADEDNDALLNIAIALRPEEVFQMITNEMMQEIEAKLSPREKARREQARKRAEKLLVENFFGQLGKIFAEFSKEQKLVFLKSLFAEADSEEQKLVFLKSLLAEADSEEQRLAFLKSLFAEADSEEQRLAFLKSLFAELSEEQRKKFLETLNNQN
jgi:hypothetical protein